MIDATNDKKDPVVKHVTFTVVKSGISIYQGVSANQGTIKAKNGVEKSQSGLGIPGTVKIKTTSGSRDAAVKWNIKDCDYNPDLKEEQSFTVWGEVVLPSDVINPAFVSRVTSIGCACWPTMRKKLINQKTRSTVLLREMCSRQERPSVSAPRAVE